MRVTAETFSNRNNRVTSGRTNRALPKPPPRKKARQRHRGEAQLKKKLERKVIGFHVFLSCLVLFPAPRQANSYLGPLIIPCPPLPSPAKKKILGAARGDKKQKHFYNTKKLLARVRRLRQDEGYDHAVEAKGFGEDKNEDHSHEKAFLLTHRAHPRISHDSDRHACCQTAVDVWRDIFHMVCGPWAEKEKEARRENRQKNGYC